MALTDTLMERIDNRITDKLLGIPSMFDCSPKEGQNRNHLYRKWKLDQATPKGCKSGVRNRYAAIHKRGLTVDHIVPLSGCDAAGNHIVCGLNVAWNLQGQTREENQKKSNSFVDNENSLAIILPVVNKQLRIEKEERSTKELKKRVDNLILSLIQ